MTVVAFLLDQLSVELPPEAMVVGAAVMVMVGGTWFTVTMAVAVAVAPFAPLAVRVYVVVCAGVTALWPFTGGEFASPVGSAGENVTDVAFVVVHVSVLNWPAVMVVGEAARVAVTLPGGGGGGGVGELPRPPHPAIKSENRSRQIQKL